MKLELSNALTMKVLSLVKDFNYTPEEIASIGFALAAVVLKQRELGNRVVIVDSAGDNVGSFDPINPRAIDEIVEKYIEGLFEGVPEKSTASLVAHLEKEPDEKLA